MQSYSKGTKAAITMMFLALAMLGYVSSLFCQQHVYQDDMRVVRGHTLDTVLILDSTTGEIDTTITHHLEGYQYTQIQGMPVQLSYSALGYHYIFYGYSKPELIEALRQDDVVISFITIDDTGHEYALTINLNTNEAFINNSFGSLKHFKAYPEAVDEYNYNCYRSDE